MRSRLAMMLIALVMGCGPGLAQQRELGALSHAARLRCQTDRAECERAKACAGAVKAAVDAIQGAQEARARGEIAPQLEASAREGDLRARAECAAGGKT